MLKSAWLTVFLCSNCIMDGARTDNNEQSVISLVNDVCYILSCFDNRLFRCLWLRCDPSVHCVLLETTNKTYQREFLLYIGGSKQCIIANDSDVVDLLFGHFLLFEMKKKKKKRNEKERMHCVNTAPASLHALFLVWFGFCLFAGYDDFDNIIWYPNKTCFLRF